LIQCFHHARLHSSFGDVEDLSDFAEFEALIMAQNNDHTIGFRNLQESAADVLGTLVRDDLHVGSGGVDHEIGFAAFVGASLQGRFAAPFDFA